MLNRQQMRNLITQCLIEEREAMIKQLTQLGVLGDGKFVEALRKRSNDENAVIILLNKSYDGESIYDVPRDVSEAFQADFTPEVAKIPTDEYGIQGGSFNVLISWTPDNE